jgi:hypothetical protein
LSILPSIANEFTPDVKPWVAFQPALIEEVEKTFLLLSRLARLTP